jgi:hypothetical protein
MQKNTIIAARNNVTPKQQICVSVVNTDLEPAEDNLYEIDYDAFTPAEKTQYDDCIVMVMSKIPAQ